MGTLLLWYIFIYAKVFLFIGFNMKIQLMSLIKSQCLIQRFSPPVHIFGNMSVLSEYWLQCLFLQSFMGHRLDWNSFFFTWLNFYYGHFQTYSKVEKIAWQSANHHVLSRDGWMKDGWMDGSWRSCPHTWVFHAIYLTVVSLGGSMCIFNRTRNHWPLRCLYHLPSPLIVSEIPFHSFAITYMVRGLHICQFGASEVGSAPWSGIFSHVYKSYVLSINFLFCFSLTKTFLNFSIFW